MNRYFQKWWTTLGLTLSLVIGSYGQETQNYSGPLTVGNYTGKANYDYYITETDTVYDGRFQMQRSNLETLLTRKMLLFHFRGSLLKVFLWVNGNFNSANSNRTVKVPW